MSISLNSAKKLVSALEAGDEQQASSLLHKLVMSDRGNPLYQQIGELTRSVHEEVKSIALDQKLAKNADSLTETQSDIDYIISTAEDSASKTIHAVESMYETIEPCKSQGLDIQERLSGLKNMSSSEFSLLVRDLHSHLSDNQASARKIESCLNDILLAQSFQDLTGQVAQRISNALVSVESNLVELLKNHNAEEVVEVEDSITPVGPNTNPQSEGNVSGQEDVDDLLASLGF